ncbi:Deoxyribose-phosphate aldolase [Trichinella pseudospiralis]
MIYLYRRAFVIDSIRKMSYRIRNVKRVNYAELCRSLCMMDDDEEDEDYIEGETGDSSKSDDSTSSEENDLSDENVHETISNLDDDPQWVMCRKVGEQWTSKEFKVFEGELAAEMNFPDRPLMEKKNRQFAEWNSDFAVYNEQRNQWTDEVVRFIHEMEELNRARKLEIEAKTVTDPENCKAQLLYLCREMARDGVQGICTIPKHLKHDANKDVLPEVNEEESANSAKGESSEAKLNNRTSLETGRRTIRKTRKKKKRSLKK